jgi:hypothetical protein
LGGEVQSAGRIRPGRDADLPSDPDRRLHLDLEEGRVGVGVKGNR